MQKPESHRMFSWNLEFQEMFTYHLKYQVKFSSETWEFFWMTIHRCTSRECIIVFLFWLSPSRPWVKPFSELVLHQEPGHHQISSHMWRAVATVLYTRPLLVPGWAALVRQRAKHLLRNHLARRALLLADTILRKKVWLSVFGFLLLQSVFVPGLVS